MNGDVSSTYYRLSSGAMLLVGPVLGLLYVVLLPFIGITTISTLLIKRIVGGTVSVLGKSLSFGWRPKEAYLAGKKKNKKKDAR